jgi:hypothetical protein
MNILNISMPKIENTFTMGSIITMITVLITVTLSWGKISNTVDEVMSLRAIDIKRIEKVEDRIFDAETRITNEEKAGITYRIDIQYIKQGIEEIKQTLKNSK